MTEQGVEQVLELVEELVLGLVKWEKLGKALSQGLEQDPGVT